MHPKQLVYANILLLIIGYLLGYFPEPKVLQESTISPLFEHCSRAEAKRLSSQSAPVGWHDRLAGRSRRRRVTRRRVGRQQSLIWANLFGLSKVLLCRTGLLVGLLQGSGWDLSRPWPWCLIGIPVVSALLSQLVWHCPSLGQQRSYQHLVMGLHLMWRLVVDLVVVRMFEPSGEPSWPAGGHRSSCSSRASPKACRWRSSSGLERGRWDVSDEDGRHIPLQFQAQR